MSTDTAHELAAGLRRMHRDLGGTARAQELIVRGADFDPELWSRQIAMGLHGLAVRGEMGGQGGSLADLSAAHECTAAFLAATPLWSVSAGLALLEECGAGAVLSDVLENSRIIVPAFCGTLTGSGSHVSGSLELVADLPLADCLVARAQLDGERAVVVLDPNDPSVERTTHRSLDLTRSVGSATLRGAKVDVVATGAEAEAALEWAGHVAAILLASEQVGAAQAVLDEAVGHACRREQFGRPIGSFQVIKHKCADMFVQVESARSLVAAAVAAADARDADLPVLALAALAFCSDALVFCSQENLQVHGGIGFTWEHSAHLYLRRARSSEVMLGSPAAHREQLVQTMCASGGR